MSASNKKTKLWEKKYRPDPAIIIKTEECRLNEGKLFCPYWNQTTNQSPYADRFITGVTEAHLNVSGVHWRQCELNLYTVREFTRNARLTGKSAPDFDTGREFTRNAWHTGQNNSATAYSLAIVTGSIRAQAGWGGDLLMWILQPSSTRWESNSRLLNVSIAKNHQHPTPNLG